MKGSSSSICSTPRARSCWRAPRAALCRCRRSRFRSSRVRPRYRTDDTNAGRGESHARRGLFISVLTLTTLAGACRSSGHPSAAPRIELNSPTRTVDVSGLSSSALAGLSARSWSDTDWQALLRVSVKSSAPDSASQRTGGRRQLSRDRNVSRFTPMFPFDTAGDTKSCSTAAGCPADRRLAGYVTAVVGTPAVEIAVNRRHPHLSERESSLPTSSACICTFRRRWTGERHDYVGCSTIAARRSRPVPAARR